MVTAPRDALAAGPERAMDWDVPSAVIVTENSFWLTGKYSGAVGKSLQKQGKCRLNSTRVTKSPIAPG